MLAIETSQRGGGVAVRGRDGSIVEEPLRDGASAELAVIVDRAVRRAGLSPRDLRAVAVSIGPGGFTGLRVAIATAKMLSEALGATVVAVPSALVAAAADRAPPREGERRLVLLSAKRRAGPPVGVGPIVGSDIGALGGRGAPRDPAAGSVVGPSSIRTTAWCTPLSPTAPAGGWCRSGAPRPGPEDQHRPAGPADDEDQHGSLRFIDQLAFDEIDAVVGERTLLPEAVAACEGAGRRWIEAAFHPAACLAAAERLVLEHRGAASGGPNVAGTFAFGPIDPLLLLPLYAREPEAVTLWRAREGASR
ncbi:MAG: tRNA (adenosine(37)-N6)-threonylcarbamoyltransferase complex dimerization subunit type 1 TsaB [Phycisphaerales bacterium]